MIHKLIQILRYHKSVYFLHKPCHATSLYKSSVSWNPHNPNDTTPQSSKISTKTLQRKFTNGIQFHSYCPPPSNDPSSPAGVKPTGNYTPHDNPPKKYHKYKMNLIQTSVCHSILRRNHLTHQTSFSKNEDEVCIRNVGVKRHNNDPIKKCTNLTAKLIKSA